MSNQTLKIMKVSPSLLAANFADLKTDLEMINSSDADYLHLDVMDGVFVPNISFGFPVLKSVSKLCAKPMDVHLMVVEPEKWIGHVRDIGAEIMNFHYEASRHVYSTIAGIHSAGMKAGVTLCPATPVEMLSDVVSELDLVLLMSVEPGFGGQKFIMQTLQKVERLREMIERCGGKAMIEVDGGVNEHTGSLLARAGADILVAGSYVFGADDPHSRIKNLKSL